MPRSTPTDTRTLAETPVGDRYTLIYPLPNGAAVSVELISIRRRRWLQRPEAIDPAWKSFNVGPMVMALRLTL